MRLDYDTVAHLYDEPLRDYQVDARLEAFLASREGQAYVLDVGCGTGKQIAANRRRFPGVRIVGVDRSGEMLRIAQRRCPEVDWVRADGARLPLATGSIDYATSQFSYHHIGQTERLLAEISRVLVAGGRFVMTNIDPWSMRGWLVYRYFPDAFDLDERAFAPVDRFVALMEEAGFSSVTAERDDRSFDQPLADFLAYAAARHRASQLMALSDEAYARGLAQLASDAARSGAAVRSEFVLVRIVGDRL